MRKEVSKEDIWGNKSGDWIEETKEEIKGRYGRPRCSRFVRAKAEKWLGRAFRMPEDRLKEEKREEDKGRSG